MTDSLAKLQQEVDMMEQRNLQLMETVNSHHRMEVEATRKVFAASAEARHQLWGSSACSSRSGSSIQLPSLTDKQLRLHTSDYAAGGGGKVSTKLDLQKKKYFTVKIISVTK